MEQPIGPIIPPVAGTDPAFIPGITPPRADEAEAAAPEKGAPEKAAPDEEEQTAGESADVPSEDAASADDDSGPETEDEETEDAEDEEATAEAAGDEEDDDTPSFEVSDRRASIKAGGSGIVFRLDGEEADFAWDEIGAVEIATSRFGRRFTVMVHTTDRRSYDVDVDAPARSLLKQWTAELDAVLDACFEDSEDPDGKDPDGPGDPDAEDTGDSDGRDPEDRDSDDLEPDERGSGKRQSEDTEDSEE